MAKDKLKTIAARSIEGFQQTDEYNTVLFSWYFKGFELLRRYLIKHPTGVDLQSLDLEVVDQEMAADEVAQSSALKDPVAEQTNAQDASAAVASDDAAADPWAWPLWRKKKFFFFNLILEQFNLFWKQCMLPNVLWAFWCECSG